jgi:hypothetical protein
VVADPTSGWTAEGSEIDVSGPDIDELNVVAKKLAALVVRVQRTDRRQRPSALQVVGDGLVRDLQVRLDAAYFGNTVADGPNGLGSLTGVQHVRIYRTASRDGWRQSLCWPACFTLTVFLEKEP